MSKILPAIFIAIISLMSIPLSATNPADWETYFENDTVKIEYTYQNCEYLEQFNSEFVILRITNNTTQDITIEWQEQLWLDDNCINCELYNPEFRKEIKISANHTTSGDCKISNNLRIFSKFTEKLEDMPGVNRIVALSKFELKNLTITCND